MPPTRAKSPKLGRKKSFNDAEKSSQADKLKGDSNAGSHQSLICHGEDASELVSTNTVDQPTTAICKIQEVSERVD